MPDVVSDCFEETKGTQIDLAGNALPAHSTNFLDPTIDTGDARMHHA